MTLSSSTVAIVGVGLLGGSLGQALSGRCARRIGVVAPGDEQAQQAALACDAVDEVLALEDAVERAAVVVLATPVRQILRLLPTIAARAGAGTLVTDLGSTKQQVVTQMHEAARTHPGVHFVGGHPMCGGTHSGVEHADGALFAGATWVLCPVGSDEQALERGRELVATVGASELVLQAAEHDHAAALVSHLPYVLAQVLVHELAGHPEAARLAAAGWRRSTHGAAADVEVWRDVLVSNAAPIVAAIDELRDRLGELSTRLRELDPALEEWLADGAQLRRDAEH